MLHPARLITAFLVLMVALVVRSSLGDLGETDQETSRPNPAAVHNQPVVEQLTLRWQQIPDVQDAHAGYSFRAGRGTITGYAVCTDCSLQDLARRLVRDVWTSDLVGVTSFTVHVAGEQATDEPLSQTWEPLEDAVTLYDRYGNGLVDPDTVTDPAS